ncbi:hypothetical protein JCM19037_967 [Geomicrobium sp. JCM 19037]|uniref:hypothetical protein n=1 Tax=unclassified Geomicrobium TaxID=2628951 RepID=UPI00045F49B0|nr:hypothetical protein [Geomicrobium sp. JCM 19037]GAK02714.1 hypothetical protein JCM19037_967 [Geomicrobium sp. JCM 19037]
MKEIFKDKTVLLPFITAVMLTIVSAVIMYFGSLLWIIFFSLAQINLFLGMYRIMKHVQS